MDMHGEVQKQSENQLAVNPKKLRVQHFQQMKEVGQPIVMLTAYDALTAAIFDAAGVDMLLVGDSLGNVMLGHGSTIPVTLKEMISATRAVTSATKRAFVVADLPFGTYEVGPEQAFNSALQLIKEGRAHAVKLEGGRRVTAQIKQLVESGIPVVGHLGFTPQSENILGGHRVQGRDEAAAQALREDALALQEAGCMAIVLEMIPAVLATELTEMLRIPTIGIGAGAACDGQVLVWADMAAMSDWRPRFAKVFAPVGQLLRQAVDSYCQEVRTREFPSSEHTF